MKLSIKKGDIIDYSPKENLTIPAYVLSIVDNSIYAYAQNRIVAIKIQDDSTIDPETNEIQEMFVIVDSDIICDYCIIPEADSVLCS